MGAGSDNEPFTFPGNFSAAESGVWAELFTKLLGRCFLAFPDFAASVTTSRV